MSKEAEEQQLQRLVASARRRFLQSDPIQIPALGAELGLSRATTYRRVGNKERLLSLVLAGLVEDTFHLAMSEGSGTGRQRVLTVLERFLRYLADSEPYRAFLERDPQQALRIVTTSATHVQRTVISLIQALLEDEAHAGDLALPVDAHTLAYAIVRMSESFLYADFIAGEEPNIEKGIDLLGLLLPAG